MDFVGTKCGAEDEQDEDVEAASIRGEEMVVCDFEEGCFSSVLGMQSGLE